MARFTALIAMMLTLTFGTSTALAQNLTHLGQPVSNLVTVKCTAGSKPPGSTWPYPVFNEIVNPDASTSPFTVPNGQVFVITDIEWFLAPDSHGIPAGSTVFLILNVAKKNEAGYISVFASNAMPVNNGSLAMHESLTAGIVVAPNVNILPEMISSSDQYGNATVFVHGYFMPDDRYSVKFSGFHHPATEQKK
jgi:hypothetical protein